MPPFEVVGLTAFMLVLFLGLYSTLFGFPGTVVIVVATLVYACVNGFHTIGLKVLLGLVVLSVLAETLEFFMGMIGAWKFTLTHKSAVGAVVGGFAGVFLMTPLMKGLGVLIGMLFGSLVGLIVVAVFWEGRIKPVARPNTRAMLYGIAGILAKGSLTLVMVVMILSSIYS